MRIHLIAAAGLAALAAACTTTPDTAGAPSFGESVRAMHEAQAIPTEASAEAPEGSGAQGALAQTRYKTGNTRPLPAASVSSMNPPTH